MKSSLRLLVLSATLALTAQGFAAERWSTDEVAVRMGVNSWLALWSRPNAPATDLEIKGLYATQPSTSLPTAVQTVSKTGALPSAMTQPGRVAVQVQGDRATTTFDLELQGGSPVVLTWERRSGLWRIVQETVPVVPGTAERVALSESTRK